MDNMSDMACVSHSTGSLNRPDDGKVLSTTPKILDFHPNRSVAHMHRSSYLSNLNPRW